MSSLGQILNKTAISGCTALSLNAEAFTNYRTFEAVEPEILTRKLIRTQFKNYRSDTKYLFLFFIFIFIFFFDFVIKLTIKLTLN